MNKWLVKVPKFYTLKHGTDDFDLEVCQVGVASHLSEL